jgi:hypothetical protein
MTEFTEDQYNNIMELQQDQYQEFLDAIEIKSNAAVACCRVRKSGSQMMVYARCDCNPARFCASIFDLAELLQGAEPGDTFRTRGEYNVWEGALRDFAQTFHFPGPVLAFPSLDEFSPSAHRFYLNEADVDYLLAADAVGEWIMVVERLREEQVQICLEIFVGRFWPDQARFKTRQKSFWDTKWDLGLDVLEQAASVNGQTNAGEALANGIGNTTDYGNRILTLELAQQLLNNHDY